MIITRRAWVLVGVFFWGLPIGFIVSLTLAIQKTRNVPKGYLFEMAAFINNLYLYLPVFSILGIAFSIIMFRIGEKMKSADLSRKIT